MTMQVLEISIQNNTARVLDTRVSASGIWRPTDGTSTNTTTGGDKENFFFTFNTDQEMMPYSLSTRNEFILTGCNLMAELSRASDGSILSVCASKKHQQCNGMGCCRSRISTYNKSNMPSQFICKWKWFNKGHGDDGESPPAYAFIAEEGWFKQGRVEEEGWWFHQDQGPDKDSKLLLQVPILLQWEVFSSSAAAHDIIKSCSRSDCHCPREVSASLCKSKHSYCKRGSRGGYTCHCSKGYDSEADANPYVSGGCRGRNNFATTGKYITIVVAIGAGVILSLFTASSVSKKLKHRRAQILKRQFFENNRGQLLRHLVSQRADIAERMIITLEEIEKATNNFDKARELGGGGHGTVYKGILSDLHVVAIKKPKMVVQKEIDEFINEVAILSQINHRNVVKLYGCCLETQVPLLVYEFISNGTLYEHLHTAKVADFGASRYVPVDRSAVTTMVQGTIGYLDPMYFYTQRLTEKSDVYSFGVVLVELLTRKKPFSYMSPEDDGLVAHFATLFAEGNLLQILDPQVVDEGGKELEAVATLAVTCVKLSGEDRPVMRQVELTLEAIRASNQGVSANSG
ncbi:hypothetical protein BRADI_2g38300v3 [Brachypodium distachyon]|uniref:Protein kinase domain-containing protein n=1 Tax=Brachypodium distachyon TaxID=15368 RepID=A0A0Q3J5F7_BRADI|nr:hypothetical protein BRADI_2g38300v3 [Brachypodium distachyon]PNT72001.1 hypothetical protein BRADI_2g38300v3 [Brachypodium distachyon]PNT72003.1 hypothetical protein BRADI_2g38300v3 [Brachypodium distachyon]PNT72005.1 hypothetical protein BRADI_2g38300v3 [Brachypodium distachyon]